MPFYRKKSFWILTVTVILLVTVPTVLYAVGIQSPVRTVVHTVSMPFEWVFRKGADAVSGFVSAFTEYDTLKEDNQKLRERLNTMEDDSYRAEVLENENAWLRDYLHIAESSCPFEMKDAVIIAREIGIYSTVLTVNTGTLSGVTKNKPVISADGLIGYVSEAGPDYAKIVTIVETSASVGCFSDRGAVSGVLSGNSSLRTDGKCLMEYIPADADIRIGDRIYTSGEGSIYPKGLLIGTVESIEADPYNRTLSATVIPAVDFTALEKLNRVMILLGYVSDTIEEAP